MSPFIQNMIIIGGVLLLIGLGFYLYTQSDPVPEDGVSNRVIIETADFLRQLEELKSIQLDGSIFSDPRFISLVNYTGPILPEPVGKNNPFDINN